MKHAAFISYSHEKDSNIAMALQSGLQKFAKPWNKLRAVNIFRDATNLSVTPGMWPSLEKALDESEYLILLASSDSARSPWVNQEVVHWLRKKSCEKILIICVDGELLWDSERCDYKWTEDTPLPQTLRGAFKHEPLYIDLRWGRSDLLRLTIKQIDFREIIASLSATIRSIPKEDLISEEVQRQRTVKWITTTGISLLTLLTLATSLATYWALDKSRVAKEERNHVLIARSQFLAKQSIEQTKQGNTRLGILLAMEGLPSPYNTYKDQPYVSEAEVSLYSALASHSKSIYLPKHSERSTSASFNSSGSKVITTSWDGTAQVWDVNLKKLIHTFNVGEELQYAAFSPVSDIVALCGRNGGVEIWNTDTGKRLIKLEGHNESVGHAVFSNDGLLLATTSSSSVRVWDAVTGVLIKNISSEGEVHLSFLIPTNASSPYKKAVFDKNNSRVFAVSDTKTDIWKKEDDTVKSLGHAKGISKENFIASKLPLGILAFSANVALLEDEDLLLTSFSTAEYTLLRAWDIKSYEPVKTLYINKPRQNVLAVHPYLKLGMLSGEGGHIYFWTYPELVRIGSIDHGKVVTSMGFSGDGLARDLVVADEAGNITTYEDFKNPKKRIVHEGDIYSLQVNEEAKLIVTAGEDGFVFLTSSDYSPVTLVSRTSNFGRSDSYDEFSIQNTSDVIVAANKEKIVVLGAASGDEIENHYYEDDNIELPLSFVSTDREGKFVVIGRYDSTIWFDESDSELAKRNKQKNEFLSTVHIWNSENNTTTQLTGHTDKIQKATFSRQGNRLASMASNGEILFWNLDTKQKIIPEESASRKFRIMTVNYQQDLIVGVTNTNNIFVWDIQTGKIKNNIKLSLENNECNQFAKRWSEKLINNDYDLESVLLNEEGNVLISMYKGGASCVWKVGSGEFISGLRGFPSFTSGASLSNSGRKLAVLHDDGNVRIWDTLNGFLLGTIKLEEDPNNEVLFSPSENLIATSSGVNLVESEKQVGTIQIWDSKNLHLKAELPVKGSKIQFSNDSRTLGFVRDDGVVELWELFESTNEIVSLAAETAKRQISDSEREFFAIDRVSTANQFTNDHSEKIKNCYSSEKEVRTAIKLVKEKTSELISNTNLDSYDDIKEFFLEEELIAVEFGKSIGSFISSWDHWMEWYDQLDRVDHKYGRTFLELDREYFEISSLIYSTDAKAPTLYKNVLKDMLTKLTRLNDIKNWCD